MRYADGHRGWQVATPQQGRDCDVAAHEMEMEAGALVDNSRHIPLTFLSSEIVGHARGRQSGRSAFSVQ